MKWRVKHSSAFLCHDLDSKLQSTSSFQDQFDFEYLLDRNFTYIQKFGTNHGWLVGEEIGNGAGSIVDKDTAHIPIFYTGTINSGMVSIYTLFYNISSVFLNQTILTKSASVMS